MGRIRILASLLLVGECGLSVPWESPVRVPSSLRSLGMIGEGLCLQTASWYRR
jgi:hypothetical protein